MAQLAVVLLALFAQMERTYTLERAAHARAVATAKDRRTGRSSVVTESQIAHAVQLRDAGATAAEIVTKTGLTRSTLYRHMPPRPPEPVTVAAPAPTAEAVAQSPTPIPEVAGGPRPTGDRLACPTCGYRPSTRQEEAPHLDDPA
ncbi:helix-turn-helix resolvase-like protein [Rhodococcus sp. AG1013]|uniref:helix-turn-helix domain-containing protein n=1 Tax=Rhodococcus sp. AG1013 TaxID=2183996 RepID=UPI000E2CC52B|nr:helix-turn-helix resolvase-like protein [Rhodococcus sp. AG1013]